MATVSVQRWEPSFDAPNRSARRGGHIKSYLPDYLTGRSLAVPAELGVRAAEVEAVIRRLPLQESVSGLEGLARFLLRSEAVASSRIEGMQVSPQNLAIAELAQTEPVSPRRVNRTAQIVANNITILRRAASELVKAQEISIEAIDGLHRALLPDEQHHGLRTIQNWIGGNAWHPLDAEFVPPPPEQVNDLMSDLLSYANSGMHAPLIQAALLHAQFETIHPYTDGNGRVGRALIHTVLTRRGLTPYAVLPVSLVLLTRSDDYLAGLTAYRYLGEADSDPARLAVSQWLSIFIEAAYQAAQQVGEFARQLAELRQEWEERLAAHRTSKGLRPAPRADAAVARAMGLLPEAPLMTSTTVRRMIDVSIPSAHNALEELADAMIVTRRKLDRGATGYFSSEVFDLLTFAERRLASTRWDTRLSRPNRPTPPPPHT